MGRRICFVGSFWLDLVRRPAISMEIHLTALLKNVALILGRRMTKQVRCIEVRG